MSVSSPVPARERIARFVIRLTSAAWTVSVAGLLVREPAEFVTSTV
jgi:hypothetical protein